MSYLDNDYTNKKKKKKAVVFKNTLGCRIEWFHDKIIGQSTHFIGQFFGPLCGFRIFFHKRQTSTQ